MEYHYCLGEQIKKAELVNYQLFTTKPMEKHGRSGVILTKSNTELFKDQHTQKLWTPLQHGNQTTHTHMDNTRGASRRVNIPESPRLELHRRDLSFQFTYPSRAIWEGFARRNYEKLMLVASNML